MEPSWTILAVSVLRQADVTDEAKASVMGLLNMAKELEDLRFGGRTRRHGESAVMGCDEVRVQCTITMAT